MKLARWLRRGAAVGVIGTATGAVALTTRYLLQTPQPLSSGLSGAAHIDREHSGDLYFTTAGQPGTRPLVLLHDFYPGASSYQFASVLPQLARDFRVYAPDWLGFGMSEHPALAYTGEFYAGILAGFLRDVVAQPAVVVANGRAANIAARAASDAPELFDRLVLVSPRLAPGWHLDPTLLQALLRLMQRASLGLVPYALLSTRPALRVLARRRGLGASSEDVLDHQYAAAHQFGAQYAVLAALTGELDLPLQHLLPTIEPPVLLVSGEQDSRCAREDMEELAVLRPYTDLTIVPGAGAAVFQDQPARFATLIATWMQRELPRHASTDTLRAGSPDSTAVGAPGASRPAQSARTRSQASTAATASAPRISPKIQTRSPAREQRPTTNVSTRRTASPESKEPAREPAGTSTSTTAPGVESATTSTQTSSTTRSQSQNGNAKSARRAKAEGMEASTVSAAEEGAPSTDAPAAKRSRKSTTSRKRETGGRRASQPDAREPGASSPQA